MLTVLVMSAEGAMAVAGDGHPFGDDLMHQIDVTKSSSIDTSSDSDLEGVHCENCCHGHGHVVSITPYLAAYTVHIGAIKHQRGETPHVLNYAQAPPTPPPNA